MINSRGDYIYYLEADRISKSIPGKPTLSERVKYRIFPDYIWEFQRTLRKLEYYKNCKKGVPSAITLLFIASRFRNLSHMLGFTIPANVFGPGLSIAHYGTIIVNPGARVGANCRLHASVNIGTQAGYGYKAPTIGSNCYIGPGAKIFGAIEIADNTAIAANAVVNKSFTEGNIAIGGIPARKIGEVDIRSILICATELMDKTPGPRDAPEPETSLGPDAP